jgi:hypothetical protein
MRTSNPNFYVTGGAVQSSNGYYVPRAADTQLLETCRSGRFSYVLTARQVGKSSLRVATARELAAVNVRCVQIDLSGSKSHNSPDGWYRRLISQIDRQLGLRTNVRDWWETQPELLYSDRFINYFSQIALAQIDTQLVIFIDEVDATQGLPFTDDVFIAIRQMNDLRPTQPAFKRLSFVLLGVATPFERLADTRRTPFNIGERIARSDFTLAKMRPVGLGLGLSEIETERTLREIYAWTGGHPYLTQRLCKAVAEHGGWSTAPSRSAESIPTIVAQIGLAANGGNPATSRR